MNTFSYVPPGFRFHPTDEELVDYYLRRKVSSIRIDIDIIKDVDLYRIEPWDLQELCKIGTEEHNEWYFFSHKDKKYPSGTRTNRATAAGFWKATGRDKAIYLKHELIGMRKTLVFYQGRAPNGRKSDWIMHEYRLETDENGTPQEEGWVVCRVFKKKISTVRKLNDHNSPIWYNDDNVPFMLEMDSPKHQHSHYPNLIHNNNNNDNNISCKKEMMNLQYGIIPNDHHNFLHLPLLESPKMPSFEPGLNANNMHSSQLTDDHEQIINQTLDQVTDWRVLDKFVASQLSHEEISRESNEDSDLIDVNLNKIVQENASSYQIDLWK